MDYHESNQLIFIKRQKHYPVCKIYHGLGSYLENCIGESERYMTTKWGEHNNPTHDSKHVKPLNENIK